MRFACILIVKIVSAGRFYVDLEQSLGMINQGMQKAKKSNHAFLEFDQKVWTRHWIKDKELWIKTGQLTLDLAKKAKENQTMHSRRLAKKQAMCEKRKDARFHPYDHSITVKFVWRCFVNRSSSLPCKILFLRSGLCWKTFSSFWGFSLFRFECHVTFRI